MICVNAMMIREIGAKEFPLWVLGDSNPANWEKRLATPFDPRHPARHNVVTPVLDGVQDEIYRACRLRIDTRQLYIRNAIESAAIKPGDQDKSWSSDVEVEVFAFSELLRSRPPIVLTFGAFSFEFARRASAPGTERAYGKWGAKELGHAFRSAIKDFDPNGINIFPLLHVTIARGKFLQSHEYFTRTAGANYFEVVSHQLASCLIHHRDSARLIGLWIADTQREQAPECPDGAWNCSQATLRTSGRQAD
jgi:hypothetical protein